MSQDVSGQSTAQVTAIACVGAASAFAAYRSFPPASDRVAWTALSPVAQRACLEQAETALSADWPEISATLYGTFCKTGDRAAFEEAYFSRRLILNALALGEAIEARGRFLTAITAAVSQICDEPGWQLPAHNRTKRSGPIDPQPDPNRPVIDLFAAETAAQLVTLVALLGDALPADLRQRIEQEVEARVLTPYRDTKFWWMGLDGGQMNNWTVWCTQNCLISAFSLSPPDNSAEIARRAAQGIDAFLAEYGDDGACPEGVAYYRHAALCLMGAIRVLDDVTGGAMAPLLAQEKLRNIADFVRFAHVSGDLYFNFNDAAALMSPCGPREFLFGKAVGSDPLCAFAAAGTKRHPSYVPREKAADINLHDRLMALFAEAEILDQKLPDPLPCEGFKPSISMFVARGSVFSVAAKAGTNGDDHNHNDVGSVIVYRGDQPVLIDLGVETYTKQTFSADRYKIWTMQSSYHNLPEFGGVMQAPGRAYGAQDTKAQFEPDYAAFETEISGAYPASAGVRKYHRTVTLNRSGGVTLTDKYDGDASAVLNLMTRDKPEIHGKQILLKDLATLSTTGAGEIAVETIPISDPRLRETWPDRVYRMRIPLTGATLGVHIQ